MNRFVLSVSRCLTLGLMTACLATGSLAQQGPPGHNVVIENTPLPVTGSLALQGSVTLAPGTSVTLATGSSVSINSSVQNPVRVRNVNDAIQPVQVSANCITGNIGCGPGNFYTVPLGKRLVIEYVSMNVCGLPGLSADLSITTQTGGVQATYDLTTAPSASPGSSGIGCNGGVASSTTSVAQPVRLYADAGTVVIVSGDRANGVAGTATFSFSMSGYLVDVPLTP